jgi:RimJ/RimL family protein N-acetyltransferase
MVAASANDAIVSRRLKLVPLRAADADDLAELLDEQDLREWLGSSTVEELRARFLRWESRRSPDGQQAWLNWAVRRRGDGQAVGWVQASVTGDRAEIAYAMLASQRRRGYGAEAVAAMVEWLGVPVVEAHIAAENEASAAVAAAVGLRPTEAMDDGEVVWRM